MVMKICFVNKRDQMKQEWIILRYANFPNSIKNDQENDLEMT